MIEETAEALTLPHSSVAFEGAVPAAAGPAQTPAQATAATSAEIFRVMPHASNWLFCNRSRPETSMPRSSQFIQRR
jgi:hypothetical protein